MKKVFAIAAFLAIFFFANKAQAQTYHFGYSPLTLKGENFGIETETKYKGFYAGVTSGAAIIPRVPLSVTVGGFIRYNYRNETETIYGVTGTINETLVTVDIPAFLGYSFRFDSYFLYPFFGPMLSVAAIGKTKENFSNTEVENSWFESGSDNSRLDFSLVIGTSFTYRRFSLFFAYQKGNYDRDKSDYVTVYSEGYKLGVSFFF